MIQELIAKKRVGKKLTSDEISWFVEHLSKETISEGQVAALAMAICINGMTLRERVSLTTAMKNSGKTLNWDLPGPVLDKHSTGGVGDKTSLLLAPILAACELFEQTIKKDSLPAFTIFN